MDSVRLFFENFAGEPASELVMLPQSGSSRKNFFASSSKGKFIITVNENLQENESFFYFSEVFTSLNLNTPGVFKISNDRKMYVQEYLGSQTLSQILEHEGRTDRVKKLVKKTLEQLAQLQIQVQGKIDYTQTFEYEKYDDIPVSNDLNYFKFFFADVLEIPYQKSALIKEFMALTSQIRNLQPRSLMIRDFQARNIMVNENDDVFFIDYQSAMEGPMMYDTVSMLYQAKANFPDDFRKEMLKFYYSFFDEENRAKIKESLMPIRLIRNLQVLGAYGLRGIIQKKEHFLKSIPNGINNLKETADDWLEMNQYPELKKLIAKLSEQETFEKIQKTANL